MQRLVPDSGLSGPGRFVWVDAKYKAHLELLSRHGFRGLTDATRDAHRADLHQALAYASLEDADQVDSMLVYPGMSDEPVRPAIATVASGRRRVRLMLVGLPFGFRSRDQRERALGEMRELLATA